jgi:hypothetical protein
VSNGCKRHADDASSGHAHHGVWPPHQQEATSGHAATSIDELVNAQAGWYDRAGQNCGFQVGFHGKAM